jgi:hypothetical protein
MNGSNFRSSPNRMIWNKGKLIGPKPPLRPGHVWLIRAKLHLESRTRDLALFNLAVDSTGLRSGDQIWQVPSMPVKAVDTTGAGDCFVGVLAAAMDRGHGSRIGDAACHAWGVCGGEHGVYAGRRCTELPDRSGNRFDAG